MPLDLKVVSFGGDSPICRWKKPWSSEQHNGQISFYPCAIGNGPHNQHAQVLQSGIFPGIVPYHKVWPAELGWHLLDICGQKISIECCCVSNHNCYYKRANLIPNQHFVQHENIVYDVNKIWVLFRVSCIHCTKQLDWTATKSLFSVEKD